MNKKRLKEILNDPKKVFTVERDNSDEVVNKEFIRALRTKQGYTQIVFASVLGVSIKTIEKWEQGSVEPRTMMKKFLYVLDRYPTLFNDLYRFDSHESIPTQKFTYRPDRAFKDVFREIREVSETHESDFDPYDNRFAAYHDNTLLFQEECCPAS